MTKNKPHKRYQLIKVSIITMTILLGSGLPAQAQTYAYVTNYGGNTVSGIYPTTNTIQGMSSTTETDYMEESVDTEETCEENLSVCRQPNFFESLVVYLVLLMMFIEAFRLPSKVQYQNEEL